MFSIAVVYLGQFMFATVGHLKGLIFLATAAVIPPPPTEEPLISLVQTLTCQTKEPPLAAAAVILKIPPPPTEEPLISLVQLLTCQTKEPLIGGSSHNTTPTNYVCLCARVFVVSVYDKYTFVVSVYLW